MTTDTLTDPLAPTNDALLDTDALLDNSYLDDPDAPPPGAKPTPAPGRYRVRFGQVEAKLDKGRSGTREDGSTWTIPPSVQVQPKLTIVEDADGDTTFAGFALNKYYRLTSEPVRFKGQQRNWSTLSAAMALVGLDYPHGAAVPSSEVIAEAYKMSDLETPVAIELTLNASYRYKGYFTTGPEARRVYFNEKLFRTGDQSLSLADYKETGGGWASRGFLLDPDTPDARFTLERPSDNAAHEVIFANLEPTLFAWKPRGVA